MYLRCPVSVAFSVRDNRATGPLADTEEAVTAVVNALSRVAQIIRLARPKAVCLVESIKRFR